MRDRLLDFVMQVKMGIFCVRGRRKGDDMKANGRTASAAERRSGAAPEALPHVTQMLAQKIATLSRALDRQAEAIVAERTDMRLIECRTLAYVEAHEPIAITELAAG